MHTHFPVSTKVALFNQDASKVLVIDINNDTVYGLPGGHLEANEAIEAGMRRELLEECGITDITLTKADFFLHSDGKVILAFVGSHPETADLASTQDVSEGTPRWLTRDEFMKINIIPNYRTFVVDEWDKRRS